MMKSYLLHSLPKSSDVHYLPDNHCHWEIASAQTWLVLEISQLRLLVSLVGFKSNSEIYQKVGNQIFPIRFWIKNGLRGRAEILAWNVLLLKPTFPLLPSSLNRWTVISFWSLIAEIHIGSSDFLFINSVTRFLSLVFKISLAQGHVMVLYVMERFNYFDILCVSDTDFFILFINFIVQNSEKYKKIGKSWNGGIQLMISQIETRIFGLISACQKGRHPIFLYSSEFFGLHKPSTSSGGTWNIKIIECLQYYVDIYVDKKSKIWKPT